MTRNTSGYPVAHTPGIHRRFFWNVRKRFGQRWWETPEKQIAKEMRMVSYRRTL